MIEYLAVTFSDPVRVLSAWPIHAPNDLAAIKQLLANLQDCPGPVAVAVLTRPQGEFGTRRVAALNLKPKKEHA